MDSYREPFTEMEKSELLAKAQQKVNEIFDVEGLGAIIFAGEGGESGCTVYAGNFIQLLNICARILSHCFEQGDCKITAEEFMEQFSEHVIKTIREQLGHPPLN